jgi:transposase InsO family protein
LNQRTAIRSVDYVLDRLLFAIELIQTDNGAELQSQFHYNVLNHGIGHVHIKPATPRLNGKVECSHRDRCGGVLPDARRNRDRRHGLFNDRLQEWEDFYNYNRPHGGLGGQTPYERLRQKTTSPV